MTFNIPKLSLKSVPCAMLTPCCGGFESCDPYSHQQDVSGVKVTRQIGRDNGHHMGNIPLEIVIDFTHCYIGQERAKSSYNLIPLIRPLHLKFIKMMVVGKAYATYSPKRVS